MIRVFIGFDPKETVAYHVLCQSILSRSSVPVSFVPLCLSSLKEQLWRQRDPLQSTDFSFSRFLTPLLSEYHGWSIFMDCDMLVQSDIAKLWQLRDDRYAVMCVQHDYIPSEERKFLDQVQTKYSKKNWSSVMLFNNMRCKALTADYVNTASGLDLHQFKWLASDDEIGELPASWNHLVDTTELASTPDNIHYTKGGPYFDAFAQCSYADLWFEERSATLQVIQKSS